MPRTCRADVVSLDGGQILVAVVVGNGAGLNNVELGVNWNNYGIYAGTIQRIWGLTTSEYIDVDFQGRTYTGTPIT